MENNITTKDQVPGFGVAGMVMCPFFKNICMKQGCELWVEFTCGENKVARCSFAWLAVVSTEIRGSIDKLKGEKR